MEKCEIIKEWYFNSEKALLIDGVRQVGKTTLIRSFFEENNIMFVEINLHDNQSALKVFNTSNDSKELLVKIIALQILKNQKSYCAPPFI